MITQFSQHRKNLAWIRQARKIGNEIEAVGSVVFAIDPDCNPEAQQNFERLRTHELALLDSMEADIPWFAKLFPTK
jgi:hypothetical protein